MAKQALKKKVKKLVDQQKFASAKKLYQQLCQSDRNDIDSWFELGTLHGIQNEGELAIECFRQAFILLMTFNSSVR